MGLKSKEWFYKHCLGEVRTYGRLCHLCWDILEKGVGQKDATRGHVTQAIGATQRFFAEHPEHIETVRNSDPTYPFDVGSVAGLARDLRTWVRNQSGEHSKRFGYNYDTLKNILTPTLGGNRTGGGGGDDEFKRVMRIIVEFLD